MKQPVNDITVTMTLTPPEIRILAIALASAAHRADALSREGGAYTADVTAKTIQERVASIIDKLETALGDPF